MHSSAALIKTTIIQSNNKNKPVIRKRTKLLGIFILIIIFAIAAAASSGPSCKGDAKCISGKLTRVVDGDTIEVDQKRIRLALTSTPELNQLGGQAAKEFTQKTCPVGASVLVDEDDHQTQGSFDRIVAKVYCNGTLLNKAILENGKGYFLSEFCQTSEFADEDWAKQYGC